MTDLSPAAQAVFDAVLIHWEEYPVKDQQWRIACALRAAHDHLSMCSPYTGLDEDEGVYWACKELLTIAAELEAQ